MKIVKAVSKDINVNFGLEKCARICLKKVGSKAKYIQKAHFRRTFKELDPREVCNYLGIEDSHDIEHKDEK